MESQLLISLTFMVVLGIGSQWLAWQLRLPSILLMLVAGFLAGNTPYLNTDELFGNLLFPIVSLSVALIMFEGGLGLRLVDLQSIGRTLPKLLLIGAAVTWALGSFFAYWVLGLSTGLALLLGAVLVVTGPTVIIPLMRQVRPAGQVANILKWEGILIDPVGATLALLVYEAITIGDHGNPAVAITAAIIKTLLYGGLSGLGGGLFLSYMLRKYWIPDFLQNPVTIMIVLFIFTLSNTGQHESGLLAVTVMGIFMANQRWADIEHIVEFKENLRVLLISGLFILLASRIQFSDLMALPGTSILFLILMIAVVRPAAVFISTAKSNLEVNEKTFLAGVAPRGIVAAAVSSVFSLRMVEQGYPEAAVLVPMTFLIIIGTVAVYGLGTKPLAQRLGVAEPNPSGFLIIGAHKWARSLAHAFREEGVTVLLSDTNWSSISEARMEGLQAYFGNALSESSDDEMDLSGIGYCIALTPNDQVNSLVSLHFAPLFGRGKVYQLGANTEKVLGRAMKSERFRGRELFKEGVSFRILARHFTDGAVIKKTPLTDTFTMAEFYAHYGEEALPLAIIEKEGRITPYTAVDPPKLQSGQKLISLVFAKEDVQESDPNNQ